MKSLNIADIHCPSCGASAHFDIKSQMYLCGYCGGKVGIQEALEQKKGFRKILQEKLNQSIKEYHLRKAECPGCGASIVFEENEAVANCAFCGKALVREDYVKAKNIPELVIPFRLTREEACKLLSDWCKKNRGRREGRNLLPKIEELKGFYLPYELIRGPVDCSVRRIDAGRIYHCSGYIDEEFINCSKQLDNLLLDGMEPYELDDMTEFDFAYVAGHHVKTRDINDKELQNRMESEIGKNYKPVVQKTLETQAIHVDTYAGNVMRMPVLLPVYYLRAGETLAAVNGQTGKVSVRAEKESHYYFLPWWLKAILSTLVLSAASFIVFNLFGAGFMNSLFYTGILAIFFMIVTLAAYSDTDHTDFSVKAGRRIFTSQGGPWRRIDGRLIQDKKPVRRPLTPPLFFEKLDGKTENVVLRFTSPLRILKMILLAIIVLFLPVIVALILNGFRFDKINLGGSAVWFCIFVPVVPIYLLKFGRIELYERPWIYIITEDGKKKRYHRKFDFKAAGKLLLDGLLLLIIPPASLAIWFGIISFCVMVYLTGFGG